VLAGVREEFTIEYPCSFITERRWFVGRVAVFSNSGPLRAVVAPENITKNKLMEEQLKYQAYKLAEASQT
jgi:hypothetical protein